MGQTTAKIMRKNREVIRMSDAGNGEDEEGGYVGGDYTTPAATGGYVGGDYTTPENPVNNANKSSPSPEPETQGSGDSSYTGNFDYGETAGGTAPSLTVDTGSDSDALKPEPEPKKPEPEKKEEKPKMITRGKRRRSLLTEEEGGILKKSPVHRRSILGR